MSKLPIAPLDDGFLDGRIINGFIADHKLDVLDLPDSGHFELFALLPRRWLCSTWERVHTFAHEPSSPSRTAATPVTSCSVPGAQPVLLPSARCTVRAAWAFPDFQRNGLYDAQSVEFSPDGSTLYIATKSSGVFATNSNGESGPEWGEPAADDLCDISVSPDGLSVNLSWIDRTALWLLVCSVV